MYNHHYELKQFKIEPQNFLKFVFRLDFIYSLIVCLLATTTPFPNYKFFRLLQMRPVL